MKTVITQVIYVIETYSQSLGKWFALKGEDVYYDEHKAQRRCSKLSRKKHNLQSAIKVTTYILAPAYCHTDKYVETS